MRVKALDSAALKWKAFFVEIISGHCTRRQTPDHQSQRQNTEHHTFYALPHKASLPSVSRDERSLGKLALLWRNAVGQLEICVSRSADDRGIERIAGQEALAVFGRNLMVCHLEQPAQGLLEKGC